MSGTPRYMLVNAPEFEGAVCRRTSEPFFGPDFEDRADARDREREARRICRDCPFLVDCAMHGLEHEDFGVWGALSERDRRALGGRGKSSSGPRATPVQVLKRLAEAGISEMKATEILLRWKARRKTVRLVESEYEEVA